MDQRRAPERRVLDQDVEVDRRQLLRRKIEASERIITGNTVSEPMGDTILERMVRDGIAQKLPGLRQELADLEADHSADISLAF